ncbi:polysaccharide biosynthesis/export family protein [Desulfovermiculus halophilus]|uniref:polysaccharide biosynthesis/export family protein n=1 Tax=Desulfovermiculus halophilus TaxID=339722 RepID=UPI000482D116|nr:polysaccharide biosynthesis/export family protein [Desulfovermiculus halophilus]
MHTTGVQTIEPTWSAFVAVASVCLLAAVLTGCAGFTSVMEGNQDYWATKGDSQIPPSQFKPKLVPITPELLIQQARKRQESKKSDNLDPLTVEDTDYAYHVGTWDQLKIGVWNHPEFSFSSGFLGQSSEGGEETYLVQSDGTIFFPYAGQMQIAGKTVEQIRKDLTKALSLYVEQPQIGIRVTGFNSKQVYVTGEVGNPTALPLTTKPMTLLDALHKAGDPTEIADERNARLTRNETTYTIDLLNTPPPVLSSIYMQDEDVLHLPDNKRQKAYVVGEVNKQVAASFIDGTLTLSEALSQAEGLNLFSANTRGVYVIRGFPLDRETTRRPSSENQVKTKLQNQMGLTKAQADKAVRDAERDMPVQPVVYQLDAEQASAMILAREFYLQPQDIVFVSSTGLTRWSRMISKLLPSVQSVRSIESMGN